MLILRDARIPAGLLPSGFLAQAWDPVEPTVLCDITIEGERITGVALPDASIPSAPAATVVNVAGALVFPGLVDAHVHLDKAHTWFRAPNRTGTFAEALEVLFRDKVNWSAEDLLRRADFSLRTAWAHGTQLMRTHVDTWLPHGETSHAVMAELRELWRGRIELQTVPLCGGDTHGGPTGEKVADLALKYGASALGGFLQMGLDLPRQINRLLAIARERQVGIDLHVDENGNPQAECLRLVAEAVLRTEFPFPVVCGHCCSLAVQSHDRQKETIALLREARIGVISLPMCNLYLQDRRGGTAFPRSPSWRGLAPIQDLLDAGVPVACASDNVRDAFFAYGDFDLLEVFSQSVRLAHLENRLSESVRVVSSTAADLVGRPELGRIFPGAPAHLVITSANSFSEVLSRPAGLRRRVVGEQLHTPVPPSYRELG